MAISIHLGKSTYLRFRRSYRQLVPQAQYNHLLSDGELETVSLFTRPEYSFISSSGVREVASFGGDLSPYVPDFVAELITEKLKSKS